MSASGRRAHVRRSSRWRLKWRWALGAFFSMRPAGRPLFLISAESESSPELFKAMQGPQANEIAVIRPGAWDYSVNSVIRSLAREKTVTIVQSGRGGGGGGGGGSREINFAGVAWPQWIRPDRTRIRFAESFMNSAQRASGYFFARGNGIPRGKGPGLPRLEVKHAAWVAG